ncbi:MAG: low specificity L-threonine aldolase [Prolixibacteraceae bacterium]|nr:low specificity L-threonine aldolase [Prolixibacteraceae bacterium]
MNKRGFASDNNSGVHPNILKALSEVNQGHVVGYGGDSYTQKATDKFREIFGEACDVYFVFNGTGANVLAINTLSHSFHAVLAPHTAHIVTDECGAPEKLTGCKLIPISTSNGKITPEMLSKHLHGFGFEHHSQPHLVSISQVTELGTVYTRDEIKTLCELAHQHNMYVHMDGARIANAAVSLDLPFREFTVDAGIDVLSFGGTKNGMMMGEAVIFFNPDLSEHAKYFRKQSAQLFSKMRYVSAQFLAYFDNDLWKKTANHANMMAKILEMEVRKLGVEITQEVQANGVFAIIPDAVRDELQKHYFFYPWDVNRHEVRWMTSFDTEETDIHNFCSKLKELLNG